MGGGNSLWIVIEFYLVKKTQVIMSLISYSPGTSAGSSRSSETSADDFS